MLAFLWSFKASPSLKKRSGIRSICSFAPLLLLFSKPKSKPKSLPNLLFAVDNCDFPKQLLFSLFPNSKIRKPKAWITTAAASWVDFDSYRSLRKSRTAARTIKKTQNSNLYNALKSIYEDSIFVAEIQQLWPQLPMLANLRCGLWYSKQFHSSCYFKSTDGHNNNWAFSTNRLNLHVALLAGLRELMDDEEESGRETFVLPLYPKLRGSEVGLKGDVELKLGRFVGDEVYGVSKVRLASIGIDSSASVFPVRGNVYPEGLGWMTMRSGEGISDENGKSLQLDDVALSNAKTGVKSRGWADCMEDEGLSYADAQRGKTKAEGTSIAGNRVMRNGL
ncbi:hypothetical protein Droror1_Dr00025043 [Drosera rotundifolia]